MATTLLASLAPRGQSEHQSALLAHPLLNGGATASTSSLAQVLAEMQQRTLPESKAALDAARSQLALEAEQKYKAALAARETLAQLPPQLEAAEDALMELTTQLGLEEDAQEDDDGTATSTATDARLLRKLTQQRGELEQARAARACLAVLAKADDLRRASERGASSEHGAAKAGLQALRDLCALVSSAKVACSADAGDQEATNVSSSLTYLEAQRDAAFAGLRAACEDRLAKALQAAGWPPAPAEVAQARGETQLSSEDVLSGRQVREAWIRLCRLQRVAVRAKLLPQPTYDASTSSAACASEAYAPLLAVGVLAAPLLARFAYHFDGDKTTNRLDKPQWALNHMSSLLRTYAPLFNSSGGGKAGRVATLCAAGGYDNVGLRELVHVILEPLRLKTQASLVALQARPAILAQTVGALLSFDDELRSIVPDVGAACRLADVLLNDAPTFDAWIEGERVEAFERLDELLDAPDAWALGPADADPDDVDAETWGGASLEAPEPGRRAAAQTTRSARGICALLSALAERAAPLRALPQRLGFLAIQDSLIRTYAARITRSLDAFEGLSGAFARALPGGIGSAEGGEADMVRGLRGSARLLKALLSASYMAEHLTRAGAEGAALQLAADIGAQTLEGAAAREARKGWTRSREERELDGASLGDLVRRGMRSGAALRPLGSAVAAVSAVSTRNSSRDRSAPSEVHADPDDVWSDSRTHFEQLRDRAAKGLERLVTSEAVEALREYAMRQWNTTSEAAAASSAETPTDAEEAEQDEDTDIPTPSLVPCLSLLSSHLSHLVPTLQPVQCIPIYRGISSGIAHAVVERVVISGGAHRFNSQGAQRFERDFTDGWLSVIREVGASAELAVGRGRLSGLGRRPEAPWRALRDAAALLTLPASTSAAGASAAKYTSAQRLGLPEAAAAWTLSKATRALFDEDPEDDKDGWAALRRNLAIDEALELRIAREIVRRRVECWK